MARTKTITQNDTKTRRTPRRNRYVEFFFCVYWIFIFYFPFLFVFVDIVSDLSL